MRASVTRFERIFICLTLIPTDVVIPRNFLRRTMSQYPGSFQGGKSYDLPTVCESFARCNALTYKRKKKTRIRDNFFFSILSNMSLLITIYNLARLKLSVLFKRIWFQNKKCNLQYCFYIFACMILSRFSIYFNNNLFYMFIFILFISFNGINKIKVNE